MGVQATAKSIAPGVGPDLRSYDQERPYYWNLESLRFVCAVFVAILHAPFISIFSPVTFVQQAWLFVDFFFVLSGFVIADNYLTWMGRTELASSFLIKRFFRLYPLHFVTTLTMGALIVARLMLGQVGDAGPASVDAEWWWLVPANFLLVHAMGITDREILNAPSWSISTEWFAYVTFALVCLSTRTRGGRVAAFALLAVAGLALLVVLDGSGGLRASLAHSYFRCIYGFALGVLVWRLQVALPTPFTPRAGGAITFLLLAGAVMMMTAVGTDLWWSYGLPPVFALIVYAMATDRGSLVRRAFEWRPLRHLGKISYSIYLVHSTVLNMVVFGAKKAFPSLMAGAPETLWSYAGGTALLALYLGLVIGCSELTYRYVEQPWRVHGRRVAEHWRRSRASTPESSA